MRVMRKRVGQFGSGQATSASVVIQSLGCVMRCLAGSSGSTPPPPPVAALTNAQAARFLAQATFGPTTESIAELREARPAITQGDQARIRGFEVDGRLGQGDGGEGLALMHDRDGAAQRRVGMGAIGGRGGNEGEGGGRDGGGQA